MCVCVIWIDFSSENDESVLMLAETGSAYRG